MTDNAFQAGLRKVIPAVLVYARREGRVLMIQKDAQAGDGWHAGKWNGLGGKLEADESPLQGARREFREEAGVELPESAFRALGTLQFPNFKPQRQEDWLVFVFSVDYLPVYPEPAAHCAEGNLHWVPEGELERLPLWEGDQIFLRHVLKSEPFLGTFWYEHKRLSAHWLHPL